MSRKALNDQREMKLLLDMYKGVSKDHRDKVQLMAAEKKARAEVDDLRMQMKKMQVLIKVPANCPSQDVQCNVLKYYQLQENKREERKRMADDDAMRKIKQLEDQIGALQKQVASHKQVDATWKLNHTNQHQRQAVSVRKVDVVLPGRPAAAASSVAFPHSFFFPPDFRSESL